MKKKKHNNNNCIGPNGKQTFFIQFEEEKKINSHFKYVFQSTQYLTNKCGRFKWKFISNTLNVMLRDEWTTKLRFFLHFAYLVRNPKISLCPLVLFSFSTLIFNFQTFWPNSLSVRFTAILFLHLKKCPENIWHTHSLNKNRH